MDTTESQRLAWWNEARFGMFIHWGLYAILAGEWKGKKMEGIGEWIMRNLEIPIEEYEKLAAQFNPVKFDAEAWVQLAEDAGMKYLVITAKHHDGFCLFDSPSNPYNIVNATPFKRDPMKELAAACHKRNIKMCFYYSQAQDWHAPGGAGHWEEKVDGKDWLKYGRPEKDFQKYLDDVVKPNLRELLTNYGPIGLIWFDTPVAITKEQSESLRDLVHELQPECLVSGRVGHHVGDYGSLGDNEHPEGKVQGAWETPATLNDTWGYKKDDHNWKSADYLLNLLVNCASKGVNYLLNVGPTAEGEIPQPSAELLKELGDWLKRNGEAIYGTEASPLFTDPSWGRVTGKGEKLYLLVKQWPKDSLKLYGLLSKVVSARVLGAEDAAVPIEQSGDTLSLKLPEQAPDQRVSVVELTLAGKPEAEEVIIQEGVDANVRLPVALALVEGEEKPRRGRGIEKFKETNSRATWRCRFKGSGEYQVRALTRGNKRHPEQFGNHDIRLDVDDKSVPGTVGVRDLDDSKDARIVQSVSSDLGRVRIDEVGEHTLTVTIERIDADADRGLQLLAIELVPVK